MIQDADMGDLRVLQPGDIGIVIEHTKNHNHWDMGDVYGQEIEILYTYSRNNKLFYIFIFPETNIECYICTRHVRPKKIPNVSWEEIKKITKWTPFAHAINSGDS